MVKLTNFSYSNVSFDFGVKEKKRVKKENFPVMAEVIRTNY